MRRHLWVDPDVPALAGLQAGGFVAAWRDLTGPCVNRNRLRQVERVGTAAGPAYLKRFLGIQLKNACKLRVLQAPRCTTQAQRERLVIDALRRGGFGAPAPLAVGEETCLGHERRSLILTTPLAGVPLSEVDLPADDLVIDVAGCLGRTVAAGVFLPDLGLDHVWLPAASGAGYGLLDFHNARFRPAPRRRELARAVVRFFRSPGGDALRARGLVEPFARAYLVAAGRPEAIATALRLLGRRLAG